MATASVTLSLDNTEFQQAMTEASAKLRSFAALSVAAGGQIHQTMTVMAQSAKDMSSSISSMQTLPMAQQMYNADIAMKRLNESTGKAAFSLVDFGKKMAQTAGRVVLPDWILFKINAIGSAMGALGGTAAIAVGAIAAVVAVLGLGAWMIWKDAQEKANESAKSLNETLAKQAELVRLAAERNEGFYASIDPLKRVASMWDAAAKKVNSYAEGVGRAIKAYEGIAGREKADTSSQSDVLAARARRVAAERISKATTAEEVATIEKARDAYLAKLTAARDVKNAESEIQLARERMRVVSRPVTDEGMTEAQNALRAKQNALDETAIKLRDRPEFQGLGLGRGPLSGGTALNQAITMAKKLHDEQEKLIEDARKEKASASTGALEIKSQKYADLLMRLESYKRSLEEIAKAEDARAKAFEKYQDAVSNQPRMEADARSALIVANRQLEVAKEAARLAELSRPEFDKKKTEKSASASRFDVIASSLAKVGGGGLFTSALPTDPLIAATKNATQATDRNTAAVIENNRLLSQSRTGERFSLTHR